MSNYQTVLFRLVVVVLLSAGVLSAQGAKGEFDASYEELADGTLKRRLLRSDALRFRDYQGRHLSDRHCTRIEEIRA